MFVLVFSDEKWARALFDYEATCDEELSFQEGQLIRVISTENNGVDDGWWRGEINNSVGLFPSLVVEELLSVDRPVSLLIFYFYWHFLNLILIGLTMQGFIKILSHC